MAGERYNSTRGLVGKLGDVRRTNNWVLNIDNVTGDGNNLELIIQRAFLPKVSLQPIELRRGNDVLKFAGQATWEGGQLVVVDVLSRKELDVLLDWFNNTYNTETGEIGFAEDIGDYKGYKRAGTLYEYAADGKFERSWPLNGLWISSPDLGNLDMTQGALKELTFTIQIDPSPLVPNYGNDYIGE